MYEKCGLGVTVEDVTKSLVTATTSSRFTVANFWADPKTGVSYNLQVQIPEDRTTTIEDIGNLPLSSSLGSTVLLRNLAKIEPGIAVGTYERYNMVRIVSITANYEGIDFGTALKVVQQAISEVGPAPKGKTKIDIRGQIIPYQQLFEGFRSGLIIAIIVIFLLLCANFQSLRLALVVVSTMPAVIAGVTLALFLTGTTLNIQSAMGAIMAVGVAVANAILLVTFADRERFARGGDRRSGAIEGAVSRLRPILMTSFAMIAGMMPLALGLGEAGDQTAPLGRAVIGGLILATLTTLLVLPSIFALLASKKATSASIDPDDETSPLFEPSPLNAP